MTIFGVSNITFKGVPHHSFTIIFVDFVSFAKCGESVTTIVWCMSCSSCSICNSERRKSVIHFITKVPHRASKQILTIISSFYHIENTRMNRNNSFFTGFCLNSTFKIFSIQISFHICKGLNTISTVAHD